MALGKSVRRDVGASKPRPFSSFADLLEARIELGEVASIDDLLSRRPELLGAMLFDWYKQGQIACAFAQQLSRDPAKARWQSITVSGVPDPAMLEEVLFKAHPEVEALQLVFPGRATPEGTISVLRNLCAHDSWQCHEIEWKDGETPDSILVGVRWRPQKKDYTSWALGIAPFEPMPFTRRLIGAPFSALVIRPGPPTEFVKKKQEEFGRPAAHLAHMNDLIGDDEAERKRTNDLTERAKDALLGSEPRSRARARVTFALPLEMRNALDGLLTVGSA